MPTPSPRLVVLGLDAVSWELLARWAEVMPNLQGVLKRSYRATLRSCDPPITVPAWAVMFSGADPGSLGLYGFRHRRAGQYTAMYIPTSSTALRPMVWDALSRAGRRVAVIGMPPGYPAPRVNGVYVSDFLTPEGALDWVSPQTLAPEIARAAGGPFFDVPFRVEDRAGVARDVLEMTRRRWKAVRELWGRERWDFFAVHDIGPDRVHHAFWKYFDPGHPRYREDPALSKVAGEFYALLDREIGAFLANVPDDVRVMVASDHGSQAMAGCFCINDWLIDQGYLVLRGAKPAAGTPIESADVDWAKTRVWGAGGYYARLFLNMRGRESHGLVDEADRADLVEQLREDLSEVPRPDGKPLGVRLFAPEDVYSEVRGDPPDLMAYFGDLRWRAAGTIGHGRWFTEENDTGPDDAVHSFDGVFAITDPALRSAVELPPQNIAAVAPTLYDFFGLRAPEFVREKPIALRAKV
jgi:predicted AlkP superfamily phosphohydrolase/phosphomutase